MRALALVAVSTLRAPSRLVRHADDLPTVEEALASADEYEGNAIVDPYYAHPDTLPMMHEWTAETFDADLEAGGHAEWDIPGEAFVFLRTVADPALRRKKHEDHLVWARESESQSR